MKLKLNSSATPSSGAPNTAETVPATPSGTPFKLKIKSTAPTPASISAATPTDKPKRKYTKRAKDDGPAGGLKKRAADGKLPIAKRAAVDPNRRISFTLKSGEPESAGSAAGAGSKLKLVARKPPKAINFVTKRRPYPRPKGVGYDSGASDAETDPSIEQQFILRMAPGDDCTYLRQAIENKTIGLKAEDGGADVSFKFLEHTLRRAIVTVRGHRYAAAMVDLPCIVENLKSWDRRGWWKVADICQMLLVLGPCTDDGSALAYQLPREVDAKTFAFAHGLTPPMHWVRKRRFRKRVSYCEIENVEEELEKLLKDDEATVNAGGTVTWKVYDADALRDMELEESESIQSAENQHLEADDGLFDDEGLAAELEAGLAEEDAEGELDAPTPAMSQIMTVETPMSSTPAPETAAETPEAESSDDDEEDDDDDADDANSPDGMDVVDEDTLEKQKELAEQREEIEDLEREVANKRLEFERTPNQLLKQRIRQNLRALEEELNMKRKAFGMDDGDD